MAVFKEYDVIDGYRIQSLIKSNIYTETYRVEDFNGTPYFLKLFVLKNIPPKLINAETGKVREIEYSKTLNHRNIINSIGDCEIKREEGNYQYYVTTYFNGRILSDRIASDGTLGETEALKIFRGVLEGLKHIHTMSPALCHNDLDPSNIILSDTVDSEPIIIDLGHISKRCGGTVYFDTADLDPLYHANETRANIFDEQGDVFSACAVLYAMLTGHAPWEIELPKEGTYKEKFADITRKRKSSPLVLDAIDVSDRTKMVLENGLKLKASERFESIQAIIDALESPMSKSGKSDKINDKIEEKPSQTPRETNDDPLALNVEIKRGGGNGFKDIAGMQSLKDLLTRQVIFVIKDKELTEKYRLTPLNGLLLYGPPGCGKTYFAEKFAEETGFNFMLIKSSDLGSSYIHGAEEKISRLFKLAQENAPIVMCFDEFDALVPDRGSFDIGRKSEEVNEFLSQMNNCSKRGIFIVATSNRPDKIDSAVLRSGRIDKNVYIPLPDMDARKEMFNLYLANRPLHENIDVDLLAKKTDGYIASDIAYIVNDAAMTAAYTRELISHELLETSIKNIRPSLRKEVLETYETIRQRMEDSNRASNIRVIVEGL